MGLKKSQRNLKMTWRFMILMYLIVAIRECKSQKNNRCTWKATCAECIGEGPMCAWCSSEKGNAFSGKSRCDMANLLEENCEIINPQNSDRILEDQPLSHTGSAEGQAVQIKPQMIEVFLRPNSVAKFSVQYRQAVDYPVDLYLLMDLSYTMKDDKENLASLGDTLGREMQNITSNFQLGFGSFVDKVVAPYSDIHPRWIENPCSSKDCAKAYSFKNHMRLSSDITQFVDKVRQSKVSANVDPPEGTLDAIMQAIVCTDEIGWRSKSRKLIVIATDGDFHYAGDGKVGGIIKPNDGKCHLNSNGFYTKGDQMDYPSMSQIKRKIKEHNFYLIFAVAENKVPNYQILKNKLSAATVGKLDSNSANIVDLIKEQYKKISSTIQMTETFRSSQNIKVSYTSKCLKTNGVSKTGTVCKGIKVGDTVTFDVSVEFSMCPKNEKDWSPVIEIHPVGLSDSLTVKLHLMCKCNCPEEVGNEDFYRKKWCSGNGTYECGICRCDATAYGDKCQCDAEGNQTQTDSSGCKHGDEENVCSNRGECRCGKCFCYERKNPGERYEGNYCQCSNFNCVMIKKEICNGHGTCECDECKCDKGWGGPDCTCIDTTENCVLDNGEVCSGHGTCDCGSCNCDENYYGKFCDDCSTCSGNCDKYGDCVECFLSADDEGAVCESCEGVSVKLTEKIEVNDTQKEKVCVTEDKNECKIYFKYKMDDYHYVTIQAESTKKCPQPANALVIAGSTIGGVLIAGIVTLLLARCLTELHDRREFAKFQKDAYNARWDSGNNPIFIEPTATYENPRFGAD